jgi:phosphatidylserine/phosphatidylglycerophosphate/cardiolipin synthase-like enzyme
MLRLILNDEHLGGALEEALACCRRRLFIATADLKDVHVPAGRGIQRRSSAFGAPRGSKSILELFEKLSKAGVEVRLLHGGVPSGPFLARLKRHVPEGLTMRRCPRVHAKAIIADGKWMYLGSANLTGAGLGAKSARRRNFEAGICTDQLDLIDAVADMLDSIWTGRQCQSCGRKKYCPVPLEEPEL